MDNNARSFGPTNHGPRATNQPYPQHFANKQKMGAENRSRENSFEQEKTQDKAMSLRNFRDLKVWQMAKDIAVDVYKTTKQFPQEEVYGLSSHMRRAAISISSNVAEGFNRFYKKDYQRFLMIALGSCGELESQIEVGTALGYMPKETLTGLIEKLNHENRMLRKLHSKVGEKKQLVDHGSKESNPEEQKTSPIQY